MFDSFYLKAKCPYCGLVEVRDFQTKLLRKVMYEWKEGDIANLWGITINDGKIEGLLGGCNSDTCRKWEKKKIGYTSGFGRLFYCDVIIKKGKIKGANNIKKRRET